MIASNFSSLLLAAAGDDKPFIAPYMLQNIIACLVAGLLLWGLYSVMSHVFWGKRVRAIFRRPFVVVCIFIAFGFLFLAFLDSISWKDNIPDDEQVSVGAREPRSILDRGFSVLVKEPEWSFKEKGFAAPLAHTEFTATAGVKRPLKFPGRHLLGTSQDGRDSFYQLLKGVKPAVVVGTLPLMISIPLALFFGVTGGYFGGKIDDFVVYIYNTLASIPSLLLLFVLVAALGQGLMPICVGLGVAGWVSLCRLSRGETLKLREMDYVQAAICLGVSHRRIITRHIIPNLMHIVIITAILAFTGLVLSESVLSYLGLGLDNSWGGLINNARAEVSREPAIWWNLVSAGTALFLLVLAVNVIGDALRDALDPRLSGAE